MIKKIFFCAFLLFGQLFLAFGQQKVIFKTSQIPQANGPGTMLFLAGDFNHWNPADTLYKFTKNDHAEYQLSKEIPKGVYNFKITRGSWQTVECSAEGKAIDNRSMVIANDTTITLHIEGWQDNFKPVEKEHTASAHVQIISNEFNIPQLDRQRRVWIYLPADYEVSAKKYSVIYMNDGQNLFDAYTSGYGEWGIDEILDKLKANEQCIVVGIDHGGEYRITEYDPYDSKYGKGRGDDYVEFLTKTLKPYIDQHYRTRADSRHTTIAGSSMGGLISMYAAVKHPDVFGNAGVFSPAFWIAPEIYPYVERQAINKHSRFYFVCGDAESESMVADMKKMTGLIRAKGISVKNSPEVIVINAQHNEKQWNGDFPGFYKWLGPL